MNKYLITGCSGFVGRHFLDYLEDNEIKCQVLGLDIDLMENHRNFQHISLSSERVDLLNQDDIEIIIFNYQPDYILHLASFSSVAFSWKNPTISFKNNVNIFLNLLEVVRKFNLKTRILSIGSSEEYGKVAPSETPLIENSPLRPVSPYAVARVSQEMLSKLYADSFGIDIIMTRSFNHIGPGQRDIFVVPSFIRKILEAKLAGLNQTTLTTGDLEIVRDFSDVRDVVKAYYLLLQNGRKGEVYNICSGNPTKLYEIIDITSKILDIKVTTQTASELIRPNDNPLIVGDNTKLKQHTGWSNTFNLNRSIHDIIDYWKDKLTDKQWQMIK